MDNLTENFHQVFTVFLFCMALTILVICNKQYLKTLDAAKGIQKGQVMYEQVNNINSDCIVKKGEIISDLLDNPMELDMEIDGVLISKSENTRENIEEYKIDHEKYRKRYAYDSNGNITRIIFNGL